MKKAKDVDEYISWATEDVQNKLQEIRSIIKNVCPEALEKISYSMPYYDYHGRFAYFAYFKDHISLFVMHDVADDFPEEVKPYRSGRATLRFPLCQKLPTALIKKLMKATVVKVNKEKKN